MRPITQREVMLRVFHECRGDQERAVNAYAAAERRGEVERKRNRSNYSPEEYAHALLLDGFAKGWLPRYSTDSGATGTPDRTGKRSTARVQQIRPADDLKGLRWQLIQLLNSVDRQRVLGEGISSRIGRLSQPGGPIPRHIAEFMTTLDETWSSAEWKSKVLSASARAVVCHAWRAIQEWKDGHGG